MFSARRLNDGMGAYVANQLIKTMNLKGLVVKNANFLILGFTFKENCPDIRNTKVIDIYHSLAEYSDNITVFDPWADPDTVERDYSISLSKKPLSALNASFDAVILAVAHSQFLNIDIRSLLSNPKQGVVYDVKSCLNHIDVDNRL